LYLSSGIEAGGRIVVTWNNSPTRPRARDSLVRAASDDGGDTFFGFREVGHAEYPVPAGTSWGVTYPYLAEAADGRILVSFNDGNWVFNRAKIARIDPAWLEERSFFDDFRRGRDASWCHLGTPIDVNSLRPPGDGAPGASFQIDYREPGPCGEVRNFPLISKGEVQVTLTVLKPEAHLLWHDSFIRPGLVEEACLRVRFAADGRAWVGAGTPVRKELTGQEYSYLAYPVEGEVPYPSSFRLGQPFILTMRCDAGRRQAAVVLSDGPEVTVPLGGVLGLCYLGAAVTGGGSLRLRRLSGGPAGTGLRRAHTG
jgi:hypothetical protein